MLLATLRRNCRLSPRMLAIARPSSSSSSSWTCLASSQCQQFHAFQTLVPRATAINHPNTVAHYHRQWAPLTASHCRFMATSSREEELKRENEQLRKEIEELKTQLNKKGGKMMMLMNMFKEYGIPLFLWWGTLYSSMGIGIYFALDYGVIGGADVIDLITSLGLDKFIDVEKLNPKYGNAVLAFIANEAIEPIRGPFVLATIPMMKRLFKKKQPVQTTV